MGQSDLVASQAFGRVHRLVGAHQQACARAGVLRVARHAQRAGYVHLTLAGQDVLIDARANPFGNVEGLQRIAVGEKRDKLLAPPASYTGFGRQALLYQLAELAENLVPYYVSITIVERLKVVDINEDKGAGPVRCLGPGQGQV